MHTYIVHVQMVSMNNMEDVANVRALFKVALELFKVALEERCGGSQLKNYMKERLPDILDRPFLIWVDQMGKSYFLNISVKERKNILICALYKPLDTLRDITAYYIAKCLHTKEQVYLFEIPMTIKDNVKHYFGSYTI